MFFHKSLNLKKPPQPLKFLRPSNNMAQKFIQMILEYHIWGNTVPAATVLKNEISKARSYKPEKNLSRGKKFGKIDIEIRFSRIKSQRLQLVRRARHQP